MLLRRVTNGVVRARFRPRPRPRLLGGLCASVSRLHRQRISPSIPSPRRRRGPVCPWAGHDRRVSVPVCWRSAAGRWQFGSVRWWPVPANRRLMPHLLRRLGWLLRREASVLRGECAVRQAEASVPSTGAAWRIPVGAAWRIPVGAAWKPAAVNSTASSPMGAAKSTHHHWPRHHRGTEDEKKHGDGDQQGENWGRSHSAHACQGESLASS